MNRILDYEELDAMSLEDLEEFIISETINVNILDATQHSLKILSNSCYGSLGTNYFRLFNVSCAEAITLTGQTVTAESFIMFNDELQALLKDDKDRIIFSDTDSAAVDYSEFVEVFMPKDDFEKRLNKLTKLVDGHYNKKLDETFKRFAIELNSMQNEIVMKREKIAKAVIVAKKNYAVDVYDNEQVRYSEPQLTITGLESIKSSTPKKFAECLEEAYLICIRGTEAELQSYIKSVEENMYSYELSELSGVITCNNVDAYREGNGFKSGTPGHIRGAIMYNNLAKGSDIHVPIVSGDKVNVVQLLTPNPLGINTFCFPDKYPSDLLPVEFVSLKGNYDKFFKQAIKRVSDACGWSITKQLKSAGLF